MSDTVRGLVLLTSVLLWLPFLRPLLSGALTLEQGLVRYGCALLLAWAGGSWLSGLVRGYAEQGERLAAEQAEEAAALRRRAEDRVAEQEG
jgi:hypothetical protein